MFETTFDELERVGCTRIVVILDIGQNRVIGAGTMFIEQKFVHECGRCGHIEDIVVDNTYRGKNLGLRLINVLRELASINGCYKVILDCSDSNVKFYEKCGFKVKERQMVIYFHQPKL